MSTKTRIRSLTGEVIEINNSSLNKEVMWSSKTSEWETPEDIFNELNNSLGPFTLDVSATSENTKVKNNYFTKRENGLIQNWQGETCWMNPPYGGEIPKWIKKAYKESLKPDTRVVCLLPGRTDTRWFHDYCVKGTVWFVKGRLKFGGHKHSAPFPSIIVIFPTLEVSETE